MRFYFTLAFAFILISCKKEVKNTDYLGIVNIEITGKKEAIPYFERGLLLLHSFEFDDAREEFLKAQESDPQMAMAIWGEAMTYNHTLWSEQDYEGARMALSKLEDIRYTNSISQIESDLIKSLYILYRPQTDKHERDIAYSKYMEAMYKEYPKNHEVAAFYALSLLGSADEGRDTDLYEKGAKIAQGIIEENSNHPGALHYLIHSYDDPEHAGLALNAANSYAKVAPDASHALHMPSHIYVASGMWDEVISSNIDSYEASLHRMERKNLDNDARGYHAFHWLEYGYLQKGNIIEAKKLVDQMQQYMNEKPSNRARVHMVFLKGTYLSETDDWDSDIADIPVDVKDLNISIRSQYHFLEGMKAFHKKDLSKMDNIIDYIQKDYERESYVIKNEGVKLCSAVTREEANLTDLNEAEIRRTQLMALRSSLQQNTDKTHELFIESIKLFEGINYSYGPPSIQKPVYELYADWLLRKGDQVGAKKYYSLALKNGPNRARPTKSLGQLNNF